MITALYHGTTVNIPVTPEELAEKGSYVGWREPDDAEQDGPQVWFVGSEPGDRHSLPHQVLHSPSGIEWGYGGSGPADLALSILKDCLRAMLGQIYGGASEAPPSARDDVHRAAVTLHQAFKWRYVGRFEHQRWALPVAEVRRWLYAMTEDQLTTSDTREFVATLLGLTEPQDGPAVATAGRR